MGHQAVEFLMDKIVNQKPLPEVVRFDTRLIIRDSCGCNEDKIFFSLNNTSKSSQSQSIGFVNQEAEWVTEISKSVYKLAKNLEYSVCHSYCQELVDSFSISLESYSPSTFLGNLEKVLQETMATDDDAIIWWNVISLIGFRFKTQQKDAVTANQFINEIFRSSTSQY